MDLVLGEVDRLWWLSVGLSRCELAEGTVRPGGVVMRHVLGQHLAQVVLVNDQQAVEDLPAQGTDHPFADGVRSRRRGGLGRILMPAAVNTAPEEPVNWPARSLIRNLTEAVSCPRFIRKLRAAYAVHAPSGLAVMPAR